MMFTDRKDAGKRLARALDHLRNRSPVVLALLRGGLPVGYEVARALSAPLDVLLVRKIGAPSQPEIAVGAVVDGDRPEIVTNPDVMRQAGVSQGYVEAEARRQLREIERRRALYLAGRPSVALWSRTVIVVDDGIATGATTRAALRAVRRQGPDHLVLAVPVAPAETIEALADEVDEIVCLEKPRRFGGVGQFYRDFHQVSDEEVVQLLSRSPLPDAATEAGVVALAEKVAYLSSRAAHPSEAGPVTACETSMSWVFLTDRHAYKMKKPMRRERLDFATLERRRHFCEEEVRLNRRLAPDVYLGVVALTREAGSALALGGSGDPIEWLVTMRRLPATGTLEALALSGRLRRDHVLAVAKRMAAFYAEACPEPFLERDYRQRFRLSLAYTAGELQRSELGLPGDLVHRAVARLSRYVDVDGRRLDERVRAGRIVEGHGDLRPEHVYLEPELVVTDCLEFDRDLRLIDPVDELGYLAMECDRLGLTHVEAWLLEGYGERTGDCPPADLVAFYKGCRALRRAMLAIWHLDAPACRDRAHWRGRAREYLDIAVGHAERLP